MASRASKLADLASTDSYAFSSVTTDSLASSGAKSAFLSGNFTITNTESKAGFATYLYTGDNTYPRSFTDVGVDLDTQWGDNTSERYGGLVWIKARTGLTGNHILCDTIRGTNNTLFTNQTLQAYTDRGVSSFNDNGFSVSLTNNDYNSTSATYASWIFQTTHRVSGTTNHGKAYTCHYNPYTGFTIVRYEGSGVAGHEIPHHLGRKLGFFTIKRLTNIAADWWSFTEFTGTDTGELNLSNPIDAFTNNPKLISHNDINVVLDTGSGVNSNQTNEGTCILYGWANSYYDDNGELNGNYEIGTYQGTGASGNKITTRGKPAWLMVKVMNQSYPWIIIDNARGTIKKLAPNGSYIENDTTYIGTDSQNTVDFNGDNFTLTSSNGNSNGSGNQYLYMVVYDNDSASGKSNYAKSLEASTLQVTNGVVSYSHGVDTTGAVNSIENLGTTTLPNISWDI